ncbi:hypothetical protein CD351_09895 [Erythrobacter sp. KY5]|uniref:hypothetical protein n=1 Tax=Erythrobacter sp. KY5 TaxID=2011159 RepID=UPI000DBF3891|nr:hypothetical protein [Erythrobacter sp. KY5]AWW74734.1 hypothetical protein CD351_09895 [Erythrobacter sp. KY5]
MRIVFVPLAAVALIGAGDPEFAAPGQTALNNPAYTTPPERWRTIEDAHEDDTNLAQILERTQRDESCNDRVIQAREASGQTPFFSREPASPDKPLAIYAVHRQQDGCSVMVMMGDPDDIRPLPEPQDGPLLQQIPARADQ